MYIDVYRLIWQRWGVKHLPPNVTEKRRVIKAPPKYYTYTLRGKKKE